MSTTVSYNGSTIATVENQTKTLLTADHWLTSNITVTDTSSGGGGSAGFASGSVTVAANTTARYVITNINTIGFTPSAFVLRKNTDTQTDKALYVASYTEAAGRYVRIRAIYSAQNSGLQATVNFAKWTTATSGQLQRLSDDITYYATTSYILEAGEYTWYAIQ